MPGKLTVLAAAGVTFVLHTVLQWYGWALADSIGHRHPLPFFLLSFPVLWFAPQSFDSFEPWMALNSAIWAGVAALLVMWAQHRKRSNRSVPGK
jgi:hypothetical protein